MHKLKRKGIRSQLKERDIFSNKGDYGHALIIAGRKGSMGAAVISAKAAIRSGVGLLTVSVPADERLIMQTTVPEAMLDMREEKQHQIEKFSAIGIGPGLGTDSASEELLIKALTQFNKPLVLDADGLNIISNAKKLLQQIPAGTIITPHPKEFDRLFGTHQNREDRINTAIKKAKEYHIIIVLKGHETAVISDEQIVYNTTGNAGLAKGGSGDALTGIITSFLAQGYVPFSAASIGVFIHGLAADLTLKTQTMETMIITDVIENFANAFKRVRQ